METYERRRREKRRQSALASIMRFFVTAGAMSWHGANYRDELSSSTRARAQAHCLPSELPTSCIFTINFKIVAQPYTLYCI